MFVHTIVLFARYSLKSPAPRLETRSDRGRSQQMSRVAMIEYDVSIDAALIAAGFAIDPARV